MSEFGLNNKGAFNPSQNTTMFINNNTKHFGVFFATGAHNYKTHRNVLTHVTLTPYFFPPAC